MAAPYNSNAGQFPKHHSPINERGIPTRNGSQGRRPVPGPGPGIANGMNMTAPTAMLAHGLPTPSPEATTSAWQHDFGPALSAPQTQMASGQPSPYLRPQASGQFGRPSVSPSQSPNMHLRTPSQVDAISRENAELRAELEQLRAERDQTQEACDNMLTELMTTQDSLEQAQAALSARDGELQTLRQQVSQNIPGPTMANRGMDRGEEKELRELRLRCNRLQGECRQKDEMIRQVQTQSNMHQNMYGGQVPMQQSRELAEAQQRIAQAQQMHQAAQAQADTYAGQLRDWSAAYDGLKASYEEVQRSHAELSQNAASQSLQTRVDGEAAQQLAAAKATLEDVKKMRDFFKDNSEKVARKNNEVMDQMRVVQDALYTKTRDFEQQKGRLEALQSQA